jgi:hypothetical protein
MSFLPEIIGESLERVLDVVKEMEVPTVAILAIGTIAVVSIKKGAEVAVEEVTKKLVG